MNINKISLEAIGGYLSLEIAGKENRIPHEGAYAVNTGRNALRCILEYLEPEAVLIPNLLCSSVLQPFRELGVPFEFYHLNSRFKPQIDELPSHFYLFYINYFGICDDIVLTLVHQYGQRLIIDNTQSFFSEPFASIPTFYSLRKFFGVPDGAYFCGIEYDTDQLEQDVSWDRFTHLLKRVDLSPEEGYGDFLQNEQLLSRVPLKRMSAITGHIMRTINFEFVRKTRSRNFGYLHRQLGGRNKLSSVLRKPLPALSYPYYTEDAMNLRNRLIENRIFIPKYWDSNDIEGLPEDSNLFADLIVHLPIDQRYTYSSMDMILSLLG